MSFTKQFVVCCEIKWKTVWVGMTYTFCVICLSNDSREENFGNFKMSGSKAYTIPSTDITASQFGNLKLAPMNVEVKENEKQEEKGKMTQTGATVWDGPLSRYNTFVSTKTPEECMKGIEKSVTKLEQDQCVDWEIEEYNAFGRMYHGLDVSEFLINVYKSSDNQYKSVIEIRRSSGDTFVHDEFFRQIAKSLEDEGILEHKDDDPKVDFSLSLTLEPLSLDSLTQLDTSLFQDLTCNDAMSGDETSISDLTDTTSTEQLGDELIDVVTDRTSYQDVFRHSSGVLCQELKTNSQLLLYVTTQKIFLRDCLNLWPTIFMTL
ncbi:hypothetical protein RFI_21774 [Reticulomyxa filosa]|uniref:Uncharacterized protein n=1 Tax=Reticulomyxa filosa TaxID=46433 RepID=X6MR59_RETFI|nr:hypothetical protein RFI_21774 [Reticulomyxa filosa]|eukprot:ETO15590.1 hypothetical protein RFI_21774 [Reticulomyxa filosa]